MLIMMSRNELAEIMVKRFALIITNVYQTIRPFHFRKSIRSYVPKRSSIRVSVLNVITFRKRSRAVINDVFCEFNPNERSQIHRIIIYKITLGSYMRDLMISRLSMKFHRIFFSYLYTAILFYCRDTTAVV